MLHVRARSSSPLVASALCCTLAACAVGAEPPPESEPTSSSASAGGGAAGGASGGSSGQAGAPDGQGGEGGTPVVGCANPLDLEGCGCETVGESRACYTGAPSTQNVGSCSDGTQSCEGNGEFPTWTACTGDVTAATEICTEMLDLDCNGLVGCADPACVAELGEQCTCDEGLIDQVSSAPVNLGNAINECCRYAAQTFTAGVSGTLTGVVLDISSSTGEPITVAIRDTDGVQPLGSVLSFAIVPSATPADMILLPPIPVVAGVRYAIVVSYDSAPPPGPGGSQGTWAGATENTYPDGEIFLSYLDGMSWGINYPDYDLHFETYVCPD